MARAHAANACAQSDSIKGLAQSIAKPAYHRLLTAEPALRRAVPTLIIAFLITICLGAFVQVLDQSRQKRKANERDLAALSDYIAERIDRLASMRVERLSNPERMQFVLPDVIPPWGNVKGRHVFVIGPDNRILARIPTDVTLDASDGVIDEAALETLAGAVGAPQTDGTLRDCQRARILDAYARSNGNVSETSRRLNVSRNTVYRALRGRPA